MTSYMMLQCSEPRSLVRYDTMMLFGREEVVFSLFLSGLRSRGLAINVLVFLSMN